MRRSNILSLTTVGLISFCAAGIAHADETVKYRAIVHAQSVQSQDVGDVDGHTVSLVRYSGLASFPDGSVGTTYYTAVFDYTKGAGPFVLTYTNLTFTDGSVLWIKVSGATIVEGTKSLFQGTGTVLGGKGRYEGAKGGDVTLSPDISHYVVHRGAESVKVVV